MFGAIGSPEWGNLYGKIFFKLMEKDNELYIDFLVISEIINSLQRIAYKQHKTNLSFKEFRNSQDGQIILGDIYKIVSSDILPKFKIVEKMFNKEDIVKFMSLDRLDFNDKAIVEICRINSFVLCTNDGDFKDTDIEILTGNPALLSSQRNIK